VIQSETALVVHKWSSSKESAERCRPQVNSDRAVPQNVATTRSVGRGEPASESQVATLQQLVSIFATVTNVLDTITSHNTDRSTGLPHTFEAGSSLSRYTASSSINPSSFHPTSECDSSSTSSRLHTFGGARSLASVWDQNHALYQVLLAGRRPANPAHRVAAKTRPEKAETKRIRFAVVGNIIHIATAKCLFNGVLSTPNE
jgi:hypothetical protein